MKPDLDRLQGSWIITTLEMDGQRMSPAMLEGAGIVVKGNRFTSTGMGAIYEGTLELDSARRPRHLDMKFDAGPEKGKVNRCIYDLEGDNWKLCIATLGNSRPPDFVAIPGSGFALETLARAPAVESQKSEQRTAEKGPPDTTNSSGAATEFEGEWRMVSGIMDGQRMENSVVKWVRRVTRGRVTTVFAGPQVMMKFEFTHDPSKSPKTIDYVNTAGPNAGKAQHGIYEFENDQLRLYVAAPGAPRPAAFTSEPGKGGTLTVWSRA